MKLKNDFPQEVRNLFIDVWSCYECGENGQRSGGLSIHHIWGRNSFSAFNASILCNFCHEYVTGSLEERNRYFFRTFDFLLNLSNLGAFSMGTEDDRFIQLIREDIAGNLPTVLFDSKR